MDTGDSSGGATARGWPSWAVALALLALVALLLGVAFVLNARLKPKVGTEPVATVAPTAVATTVPSPVPSTVVPAVGGASSPAATSDAAGEAAAVTQAYLHYWDVYSAALYDLDTSHLNAVMAGDELDQAQQEIDGLRSQGHAAKMEVEHHFAIIALTDTTATIQDEYLNRSYLVDAATKRAIQTPPAGAKQTISCQLVRQDGTWKVVRVVTINETIKQQ